MVEHTSVDQAPTPWVPVASPGFKPKGGSVWRADTGLAWAAKPSNAGTRDLSVLPTHEASPCPVECCRKYLKVSPVNAAMFAVDLGCYTLRTQQHEPTMARLTTSIQVRHMHEFFFWKSAAKKHKTLVNLSVIRAPVAVISVAWAWRQKLNCSWRAPGYCNAYLHAHQLDAVALTPEMAELFGVWAVANP